MVDWSGCDRKLLNRVEDDIYFKDSITWTETKTAGKLKC